MEAEIRQRLKWIKLYLRMGDAAFSVLPRFWATCGLLRRSKGDYDRARALYQESLSIRRELGDRAGMAELFTNLGTIAQKQGDYDAARDLYEVTVPQEVDRHKGGREK